MASGTSEYGQNCGGEASALRVNEKEEVDSSPIVHGKRGTVKDGMDEPRAVGVGGRERLKMRGGWGRDVKGGHVDGIVGDRGEEKDNRHANDSDGDEL